MFEQSLPNTYIFSKRHNTAILEFRNPRLPFSATFEVILNSEMADEEHKNVKSVALNRFRTDVVRDY